MKITKIRAVGPTITDFPLEHAEPEGPYLLKGVDGLNPVDVTLLRNGGKATATRQVVLLVGLQPDYNMGQTSEELRTELYGLLTPHGKSVPELHFMEDASVRAYVQGNVVKMEAGLFSADPEVQITVECIGTTRSYLMGPNLMTDEPSIPGGVPVVVEIDNPGTAPSGFKLSIEFENAVDLSDGVTITDNIAEGQWMKMNKAFAAGERLIIDTREGSRGVWSVNAGSSAKIVRLNQFDYDSDWMTFHNGINYLNIDAEFTWYESGIQWRPAYQGV